MSGADKKTRPPQDPERQRARQRESVLREVSEHIAKTEAKSQVKQPQSEGTRRLLQLVNVLILAFAGYVWIGNPSWAQVERPEPPPPQEQEAALRFTMYVQAQQIESFRRKNERMPSSLQEVGSALPGMHFQQLGQGAYRLTGVSNEITLVYTSSQSLAEFIGESGDMILAKRRESS